MSADDDEEKHTAKTIPPPAGEADIYEAKTQVGGLPPEALEMLRALRDEAPSAGAGKEANVPVYVEEEPAPSKPRPAAGMPARPAAPTPAAGKPAASALGGMTTQPGFAVAGPPKRPTPPAALAVAPPAPPAPLTMPTQRDFVVPGPPQVAPPAAPPAEPSVPMLPILPTLLGGAPLAVPPVAAPPLAVPPLAAPPAPPSEPATRESYVSLFDPLPTADLPVRTPPPPPSSSLALPLAIMGVIVVLVVGVLLLAHLGLLPGFGAPAH